MNNEGKIVKAEYIRKLEWENDILKVTDSIKSEMYNKMEEIILDHFEMNLIDLREYMHDKNIWKQKYNWNILPDEYPKEEGHYMITCLHRGRYETFEAVYEKHSGKFVDPVEEYERFDFVIAWTYMPEPYKPKESDMKKEHNNGNVDV